MVVQSGVMSSVVQSTFTQELSALVTAYFPDKTNKAYKICFGINKRRKLATTFLIVKI